MSLPVVVCCAEPADCYSPFPYPADVSSVQYFQQLMEILQMPRLRKDLLMGLVSSATAGTEDICRAACNAFVFYMQLLEADVRKALVREVSSIYLEQLDTSASQDDRQVLPVLDFVSFTIDQSVFSFELITEPGPGTRNIWAIMQKVHSTSSSLQRTESSLNLYSRLLGIEKCRTNAVDKVTRQLLHRWPKVTFLPLLL